MKPHRCASAPRSGRWPPRLPLLATVFTVYLLCLLPAGLPWTDFPGLDPAPLLWEDESINLKLMLLNFRTA